MSGARSWRRERRGYALIAVLWIVTAASVLGAALRVSAGNASATGANRINMLRSSWIAEGCAERARAAIDEAMRSPERSGSAWNALDTIVATSALTVGCRVVARPSGTTVDANDDDEVRRLLNALGEPLDRVDSLVAALDDWRDADQMPRPLGAEDDWYVSQRRPVPRNDSLRAPTELRLVRGFDHLDGIDTLVGIDRDRIVWGRAPLPVIASLPGMTLPAVTRVAEYRARGEAVTDLSLFANALSPEARDALLAHYAQLVGRTTITPDAWILSTSAEVGNPPVWTAIELRLVRDGTRAAIVRRRSWP